MPTDPKLLKRLMSNIFTSPDEYRIAPDKSFNMRDIKTKKREWPVQWWVYNPQRRLCHFDSKEKAEGFVAARTNPVEIPARAYEDICRCGISVVQWQYCKVGDIVFERCTNCKQPMRHDVMVELNRPLIEDFDLEAFLGL